MGVPNGDDVPSSNTTTHGDDSTGSVSLSIWNTCKYPSPPMKMEMNFDPKETMNSVRQKLAQKLDYKPEAFDIMLRGKKLLTEDEEKSLDELNLGNKGMLNLARRKSAQVSNTFLSINLHVDIYLCVARPLWRRIAIIPMILLLLLYINI